MGNLYGMKWAVFLILLSLVGLTCLNAQNQELRDRFENTQNDTVKINTAKQLFGAYVYSQSDSAVYYAEKVVSLSKEIGWQENEVLGNKYLGIAYSIKGDFETASGYMQTVLDFYQSQNDSLNIAFSFNNLGTNYLYAGDYLKAAESLIESMKLKEALVSSGTTPAEVDLASTLLNIGIAYESQSDTAQAKTYYLRAIDAGDEAQAPLVAARARSSYGSILSSQKRYEQALLYFRQTESVFEEANDVFALSKTYNNMARAYGELDNATQVISYAQKAINTSQQIGNRRSEGLGNMYLGLGYIKQNQFRKAITVSNVAKRIGEELESLDIQQSALKNLHEAHSGLGNHARAYQYLLQFQEIDQQLYDLNRNEQIEELTARYEADKRQMEIDNLSKETQVQSLQLDKAAGQRNLLITLLISAVAIIGSFIYFYKRLVENRKELSLANSELERLNSTKDRFFSIISHDLRSHIASFQGSGRLMNHLVKKKDEDKLVAVTRELDKNADNLSQLLDNLLQWSVGQLKGYEPKMESINLKALCDEVIKIFKSKAEEKGVQVMNDLKEDDTVMADRGALAVTLRNLISNGLKFTHEGEVSIFSKKENGELIIGVKDTGVGIPEEMRADLFEINEEKIRPGTDKEKGTGLGLNLAYEFTRVTGGYLDVESEVGVGSTFLIHLNYV